MPGQTGTEANSFKYHPTSDQPWGEFLLTQNKIIGYSQWGDRIISSASLPEKYNKTIFGFQSMPDFEKGVAQRRNMGPQGSELVYTFAIQQGKC